MISRNAKSKNPLAEFAAKMDHVFFFAFNVILVHCTLDYSQSDLRAAKALPRKGGRRPLMGGRSQKEGRRGKRDERKVNKGTFEFILLTVSEVRSSYRAPQPAQ